MNDHIKALLEGRQYSEELKEQAYFERKALARINLDCKGFSGSDKGFRIGQSSVYLRSSFGIPSVKHRKKGFFPKKHRIYRADSPFLQAFFSIENKLIGERSGDKMTVIIGGNLNFYVTGSGKAPAWR